MRKLLLILVAAALFGASWRDGRPAAAPAPGPDGFRPAKEILVPYDDLPVLLEEKTRRVLLTRAEYEQLIVKAKRVVEARAPVASAALSAEWSVRIADERAVITGRISIDVLEDGLLAVGLDLGGVGFRSAMLDGKPAPVGLADDGRPVLFVEGKGMHALDLDLVAPLQTTAARQVLDVQLPSPAAAKMRLAVPGDVEIKSGAPVVSRVFDEKVPETRFELLPAGARQTIVMTLNSRLKRHDRVVVSRAVQIDQVTEAFDRLSATFHLDILHRAVDGFRFVVPDGFDVTDVQCPQLSRWNVAADGAKRVLEVYLREETTGTVTMSFAAARTRPDLAAWTMPKFEPLDVVGHSCVLGVLLEDRLRMEGVAQKGLVEMESSFLKRVLPETFIPPGRGETPVRPVLAYFAPQGEFDLAAKFPKPPAKVRVQTSLLVQVDESAVTLKSGGFSLVSEEEKLFGADLRVPAGWEVTSVQAADGSALKFEKYPEADGSSRLHVTFPKGVDPLVEARFFIEARREPRGWLDAWTTRSVEVPAFSIVGASRDEGAVAILAADDLAVRPEKTAELLPIDKRDLASYGFSGITPALAWRYESQPWSGTAVVDRVLPRLTAQTFSFFVIRRDALAAHYELSYTIAQARTRTLSFMLPASTPAEIAVAGLDGLAVKEFTSSPAAGGAMRKWSVTLAERRDGVAKIAVDFQQKLSDAELSGFTAPVVRAADVAYEWGRISVEGSDELDVGIKTELRPLDVGELVDAKYQPGNRLLGVYSFVGEAKPVSLSAKHDPAYDLPPAIVQRAEFTTVVSASGLSETAATFSLRTSSLIVGIRLPKGSTLWSAMLDGEPLKPQLQDGTVVVSIPAGASEKMRALSLLYETPIGGIALWSRVGIPAASLELRMKSGRAAAIPVVDTGWRLYLPANYRVVRSEGTMTTGDVGATQLAVLNFLHGAYAMTGGTRAGGVLGIAGDRLAKAQYDDTAAPAADQWKVARADEEATKEVDADAAQTFAAHGVTGTAARRPGVAPATSTPVPAEAPKPKDGPVGGPVPGPGEKFKPGWRKDGASFSQLSGFRSLPIELQPVGEPISFASLGAAPKLDVTVASVTRIDILSKALALIVLVVGAALTRQTAGRKAAYVFGVAILATLIPMIALKVEMSLVFNEAFYAAAVVAAYYLALGIVRWTTVRFNSKIATAVVAIVLAAIVVGFGANAFGDEPSGPYVVQVVGPEKPVKVPDDAILVPYDPESRTGIQEAGKLLVPYDKFVELWNLAYPDKRLGAFALPAAYSLSGASLRAKLEGDDYLLVQGSMDVTVYAENYAAVPLALDGGVLAKADLDGRPARLGLPEMMAPAKSMAQSAMPAGRFVVLYVAGKGKHTLEIAVRMKLERQGGWRIASGRLPASVATALTLDVPAAQTEVVLSGVTDRPRYETGGANQKIETALDRSAVFSVRWRPRVLEGQIDTSLTADSTGLFDVREDQLRLVWTVTMSFRKGERDSFSLDLPAGYVVEKVSGSNVRGWEAKENRLNVILLNKARESERFEVSLWKQGAAAEFDVPAVAVPGASRQSGSLVIRRSPFLDVRTGATAGVSRIDYPSGRPTETMYDESLLGLKPYQAWQFNDVPFTLKLTAAPVAARTTAAVETLLRLFERERAVESSVRFQVRERNAYQFRVALPDGFTLKRVDAPGVFEWAVTTDGKRRVLTVYLADGGTGEVAVVMKGTLDEARGAAPAAVPVFEPVGVDTFNADVAVVVDPAWDVRAESLAGLESIVVSRVFGWLSPENQAETRLALHYFAPGAAGKLTLAERKPDVSCTTMTNVRVTDRSVEESIMFDFAVAKARIREVSFLLPARMKNAVVHAPLMRQKSVSPVTVGGEEMLRVKVELQDGVMGQIVVLVDDDRVLSAGEQFASIPAVETGKTIARYVVLESAGRDEVLPSPEGLEPIGRQQKVWERFREFLKSGASEAWAVKETAAHPALGFRFKTRELVKAPEARIGLAKTVLTLDAGGAYRAVQTWWVSNAKEQFLAIRVPDNATIWTAWVAGDPVKPVVGPADGPGVVRLPLVKTAEGDLDYQVVVKYGGQMPELTSLSAVTMPLVRTVNVKCERSLVDLYLPRSLRWLYFTGTMREVRDEAQYVATEATYWNDVATHLIDSSKSTNPYARARADANKDIVQRALTRIQDIASREQHDTTLDIQVEAARRNSGFLSSNGTVQQAPSSPSVSVLNREKMEKYFEGQSNDISGARQAGDNFRVPQGKQSETGGESKEMANSAWGAKGGKETGDSGAFGLRNAPAKPAAQPSAADVGQKVVKGKDFYGGGKQQAQQLAEDYNGNVQRYQQRKLDDVKKRGGQMAQNENEAPQGGRGFVVSQWDGYLETGRTFQTGAGLASLDVDFPTRGRLFRFTMPTGEVEVTGHPVSVKAVSSVMKLGLVILVAVAALVIRAIWRRVLRLGVAAQAAIAVACIVVGLVMLLVGLFPLIGLAGVVGGIVRVVVLHYSQKKAVAA